MLKHKVAVIAVMMTLVGCATKPNTIYSWNNYQDEVYNYYHQDTVSVDEQTIALEKSIEMARAENKPVPPGLHAHLGMLYAELGQTDKASHEFETEKQLFPESAVFMDFLLKKQIKKG